MHQNTHQPEENRSALPARAPITSAAETRIEACIRRALALQLTGLSLESQEEMLQEARAQLHAMIAAYVEMGSTPDAALAAALDRFSQEAVVSDSPRQTVRLSSVEERRQSQKTALKCFAGATAILMAVLFGTGDAINYDSSNLVFNFYLLLPCIAGLGVGLMTPTRPVKSTLSALGRLAVPTLLLYMLWVSLQRFDNPAYAVGLIVTAHAISWTLFGSAAAGVGGLSRRLGQKITRRSIIKKLPVA